MIIMLLYARKIILKSELRNILLIFKLPDILTVDFNSVDECDAYKLRNCLYIIPLRKPIDKFLIFFYKKSGI